MITNSPASSMPLAGKTALITGAARRLGRVFALTIAAAGGNVIIHHGHSQPEAEQLQAEIEHLGRLAWVVSADLEDAAQVEHLIPRCLEISLPDILINNAAVFDPETINDTSLAAWQQTLSVNLTAPFLISQAFARALPAERNGRIVNMLDWRALRPGADHFAYSISKAALAAMTKSMSQAFAPAVAVNGLALGAILPPSGGANPDLLKSVPAGRWARQSEVEQALLYLLCGPDYLTGEIVYLDGGRHLV
jgi:NAD(P)-dependent dehydrogenase (short-subunit alcohol dehydrogenase family)